VKKTAQMLLRKDYSRKGKFIKKQKHLLVLKESNRTEYMGGGFQRRKLWIAARNDGNLHKAS